MTLTQTNKPNPQKPLRVWPGVVIVILQWLAMFGVPAVAPGTFPYAVQAGLAGGLAIVVWWALFSRAPWFERLSAIALMIVAVFATRPLLHVSVATAGMGMLFFIYAVPVLSLALVAWAVATRRLSSGPRRVWMVATVLLASGIWALVRTEGVKGDFGSQFAWRWTPTPEERLLAQPDAELAPLPAAAKPSEEQPSAQEADEPAAVSPAPVKAETPREPPVIQTRKEPAALTTASAAKIGAEWPGFRGPRRDGIIPGVEIETDWSASPPVELWRRPVGPGWSSFAVRGNLLYTQEQRGDDEVVTCYNATTGEPVWRHRDAVRFWESNGGAGPRATPTLSGNRLYTLGATGILNALDAADGSVVWSRNATSDTGKKVPYWGISSSPLVVGEVVIIYAGALVAYDLATGEPRWFGPDRGVSYSSPHLVNLGGVAQIVMLTGAGAVGVAPADGALLWEHPWPGSNIVQPALTADGGVLISANGMSGGTGTRRLAVAHTPGGWSVEERWTSIGLKPYFNDFVVHDGHAYGFDGSILACIDLKDGKRKWKGGRYGHGQLVLLPDQDLLLVLSEDGELALVSAVPDQFAELSRLPAIEGKTWNHPVLVGDVLLVRNGQEMAAFRLATLKR
jgi:outer membrane protein assembly factor BamB